jgi:hypothetical protein
MINWYWIIPAVMIGTVVGFFAAVFIIALLNGGASCD